MIKMKDVFPHGVINDADSLMAKGYGELADFSGYKKEARYAAYAINNHDRLTEENERLLEALTNAYDLLLISGWDDAYKDDINQITKLLK